MIKSEQMESPIEMEIIKIENEDFHVLSVMMEGASTLYEIGSVKNLMAFHTVIAEVSKTILDESLQLKSYRKRGCQHHT